MTLDTSFYVHSFDYNNQSTTINLIENEFVSNAIKKHGYKYLLDSGIDIDRLSTQSFSTILDIGANIGIFSHFIYNFVSHDKLLAFEPYTVNYECLTMNIPADSCMKFALGNIQSDILFGTPKRNNHGMARVLDNEYFKFEMPPGYETVKQITLDSLNLTNVDLMKIDVETWECKVIEGAMQTITTYKPEIFLELHWEAKQDFISSILPKLHDIGYRIPTIHVDKRHTMLHLTI